MSDKVCGRLRLLLPFSLILGQLIIRPDPFDPTGSLIHSLCMCVCVHVHYNKVCVCMYTWIYGKCVSAHPSIVCAVFI